MAYQPLAGVRVLDIGKLIPSSLVTQRLAAFGADVVKIESPRGGGDYLDRIGPFFAGASPTHMNLNAGKRSVHLDLREPEDRATFERLVAVSDVIVENAIPGVWAALGVDLAGLRSRHPKLIVCSISGFGLTGPWAPLASHGLNVDAVADCLNVAQGEDGPRTGWVFTGWGVELGAQSAAMAICAALAHVSRGGSGEWIDASCWDAAVEAHRDEIAANIVTGEPFNRHGVPMGEKYNIYTSSDGRPVLISVVEPKFWQRFCENAGRTDLIGEESDAVDNMGQDARLRREIASIVGTATADEWEKRFTEWRIPGSRVLTIDQIIHEPHFEARKLVERRGDGQFPNVTTPVRWHEHDHRAGSGMEMPPDHGEHTSDVLAEWLVEQAVSR